MNTRRDVLGKNKKSPRGKKIRQIIQFDPDTTGLDSRGRKLKWSGDLSKVQVNLNNIFIKNAIYFAPSLRIHPPPSTSRDSTSKKDKISESIEDLFAKFCNPKECQTQQHKRKHEEMKETIQLPQKDCSKYLPEQGQDEEKTEEESEKSSLAQPSVSNSRSEIQCDQEGSDENEFDRQIMYV